MAEKLAALVEDRQLREKEMEVQVGCRSGAAPAG